MFTSISGTGRQFKIVFPMLRNHIFGNEDMCVEGDGEYFDEPFQEFIIDMHTAVECRSAVLVAVNKATGQPAGHDMRKHADSYVLDVLNRYLVKDFAGDHLKMIEEYRLPDGLDYDK